MCVVTLTLVTRAALGSLHDELLSCELVDAAIYLDIRLGEGKIGDVFNVANTAQTRL